MTFSLRKTAVAFAALSLSMLSAGSLLAFPTGRSNARMVFDESLDRIVLFGGVTDPDAAEIRYELNDTWEWTGLSWIQIFPEDPPPPRSGHAMVYDSNRRQTLLFGGIQSGAFLGDTWKYQNRSWTQINPPSSPPARTQAGAAFDPLRDRFVLHGGVDGAGTRRDTWEFDGTTWTQKFADGPALQGVSMVYDEARAEVLMLGYGTAGSPEMYRLTSASWERITPEDLPSCVAFSGMTFQKHNGNVLFVGGQCLPAGLTADTWEWDGTNWTDVTPTFNPGAVVGHALAYDRTRNEAILFGGIFSVSTSDTFRYRNEKWTRAVSNSEPAPRSLPLMVYDPVRNVTLMYGGVNSTTEFVDFWQHDGVRWSQIQVEGTPNGCSYPVGAWDSTRNRLVMICQDASVFEWDGTEWFTFNSFPDDRRPRNDRRFSSVVYDPRTRRVLLFGGYTFGRDYVNEFWSWDGTSWTQLARNRTAPAPRSLSSMFYDSATQKIILFGGIGRARPTNPVVRYGDQWSWDGTNWTEMTSVTVKPPARYGAQTATDPLTGNTVIFGGKNDREEYINDQWRWNGTTWTQMNVSNRPAPRMNGGFVHDTARERFLLFGGFAGLYYSETRTFDGSNWSLIAPRPSRRRGVALTSTTAGSAAEVRIGIE